VSQLVRGCGSMLAGSINVMFVGKSSRIMIRFSVRSSNVSTKPNQ